MKTYIKQAQNTILFLLFLKTYSPYKVLPLILRILGKILVLAKDPFQMDLSRLIKKIKIKRIFFIVSSKQETASFGTRYGQGPRERRPPLQQILT